VADLGGAAVNAHSILLRGFLGAFFGNGLVLGIRIGRWCLRTGTELRR
jgi:hypothetical protein